ncbi:RNA polymerase sigma factor SigJ [Streptomyces sp. B1866]|uniref:RNA polymerase sigma factor SigJ n=1 Tax=Streptomyces sp. B1866 TaxID=3075431 RepID=UPI00288C70CD|nr:RNA polymerase sigma factor SigJ [Streptomyces sp. B1866]MDT3399242.1 RNA polymerase sigma factor SigJ [Streptomyces sp. B1866]
MSGNQPPPSGGGDADGAGWLADRFEGWRPHLRVVAYSMLGSRAEAEDAVQEAWLRLSRSDDAGINDLRAWLTTVVGRICLDMLRARRNRREDYPGVWLPQPIVRHEDADDPEQHAIAADSIGLALLVVLETLNPAERLAFVLHDVFGVPYDEIAHVVGRTPEAARQLASRARRRVQQAPRPDADLPRQRRVVDAFLAAAREGDFGGLLDVLDPEVTVHIDRGPLSRVPSQSVAGADAVSGFTAANARRFLAKARPVTVNGGPGILVGDPARPAGVVGFTVVADRIVRIDVIADRAKLRNLSQPEA